MIYSKKRLLNLIDRHIESVKCTKECVEKAYADTGDNHFADKSDIIYLDGHLAALDRLRREIEPFKRTC